MRPYEVNGPHWNDGATARHWIAVPDDELIRFSGNRGWNAPEGTVLVQNLERDGRRQETRVLTQQDGEWAGYSYLWDANQQDATLVSAKGTRLELPKDRIWNIPSRAE